MNGSDKIILVSFLLTIFFYDHATQHYGDECARGKKPLRILVVAPHPDDDVIGCGGTIIDEVEHGNHVTIVYMTSGDAYAFGHYFELDQVANRTEIGTLREQEVSAAAAVMHVSDLLFLRYPDGNLKNNKESVTRMAEIIGTIKPHIIYCPHYYDEHKDHKMTHKIVTSAIKQAAYASEPWHISALMLYEVWTALDKVNYLQNISATVQKKIKALECHKSQINRVLNFDLSLFNQLFGAVLNLGPFELLLPDDEGDLVIVQKYNNGHPVERFVRVEYKNELVDV